MGCDSGSFRVVFLNPFQEHAHWVDRRLRAAPGCTCDPIVDGCVYVELRSHVSFTRRADNWTSVAKEDTGASPC